MKCRLLTVSRLTTSAGPDVPVTRALPLSVSISSTSSVSCSGCRICAWGSPFFHDPLE
jgi:hypothetical protein